MRHLILLGVFFISFQNNSFSQTGTFIPEMAFIDTAFQDFMEDWNVPGGTISVVRSGRLVYSRGFGYADTTSKEEVLPTDLFRIASISKPITGIAIMKMIEDGIVQIDDTVFGSTGILSEAPYDSYVDSRVSEITVKQLLQHTSGFSFYQGNRDPMFLNQFIAEQMFVDYPADAEKVIQFMLENETLDNDPGTNFFYSNFGHLVLGKVIEKLTEMPYEQYVQTFLENDMGITSMKIGKNLLENRFENEVIYYDYPGSSSAFSIYDNQTIVPWPYGGFHLEIMDSHGGWIASSEDLVKMMVHVDGFETVPDVLDTETIALFTTPSSANPNYAMGIAVNQWNNWWHNGSLPGTTSLLVRASGGTIWSVLMNTRDRFGEINNAIDNFMWDQLRKVQSWPTHDLFDSSNSTSSEIESFVSGDFKLNQNYPNPFNPNTEISFSLPTASDVTLTVYNALGQEIQILVDTRLSAGFHSLNFEAKNLPTGIYFYTLKTGEQSISKKMTLMK